jgi:NAD(P)-dependent dehydrogenase (short-subunit alcohol dehydrogenase family)
MKVRFDLEGNIAVITGGAGVLCSEMSKQLGARGVKVVVLDLHLDKARTVADEILASGGCAIGLKVDVLDKESVQQAKDEVLKAFGRVDILINGAGGNKKEATVTDELSFFDLPVDALRWVMDLNFLGTVIPTQVFGEVMAKQGNGNIINISSMSSFAPLTKVMSYSAAKAAINNFTQWMAVYFNHNYSSNIRVNAIAPGFLLTEQNSYLLVDSQNGTDTDRGKLIKQQTPMGRYGYPDELVGAVIWLASDAASFVNGAVIPIDGGFLAYAGV